MTVHTLLRHLPQFKDGAITIPVAAQVRAASSKPVRAQSAVPAFSRDDIARATAEARRTALEEAEAARAACTAAQQDLARCEATMAERLAAARAKWCREEGERLTGAIQDAIAALQDRLGDTLAGVLSPFISDALRRRAIDEMADRLSSMLVKGTAGRVFEVSGQEDLVAAIKSRLGESEGVSFRADAGSDVRIVCNDTLIETQLAAWATALAADSERAR